MTEKLSERVERLEGPPLPHPSTWKIGCVAHQVKAMVAMNDTPLDFPVLSFTTIAERSRLTLAETRAAVRQLAVKGAAEYWRSSWSDDGEFMGAGYALTDQGRRAAKAIEARGL